MTKARDLSLAAKAPIASPVFTGNVGVGVTPANNATPASGVQVGATASIGAWESGSNIITTVASNSYYNSAYKYITTNTAALIRLINGAINFNVAPSGSANAAISWTTAMNINAAGIVTKPLQPAFCMSVNAYSGINAAAGVQVVRFGNQNSGGVLFNNGNNFDTTNYRFVAPVSGFYQFNANIRIDSASGDYIYLTMTKNGSTTAGRDLDSGISSYNNKHVSQVLSLSANDYVDCNVRTSGDTGISIDGDSYFSGHLIG